MISPGRTRRHAIIAIVSVSAILCGVLGWATQLAIERDRHRAETHRVVALDVNKKLAVARVDVLVSPILLREARRPYNHFLKYYRPFHEPTLYHPVLTGDENATGALPELVESPLSMIASPPWILLHFTYLDTAESSVWVSPQIDPDHFDPTTLPVWMLPASERTRMATPENWLAAMEHVYPSDALQADLDQAMAVRGMIEEKMKQLAAPSGTSAGAVKTPVDDEATRQILDPQFLESVRDGARLLKEELERPIEQCVVEVVARENLGADSALLLPQREDVASCTLVFSTDATPMWMDLAMDEERQLALVRRVSIDGEGKRACALQGVVINWSWLGEVLTRVVLDQVGKDFPYARLTPVLFDTDIAPELLSTMLTSLPARIEFGQPALAGMPPLSSGLKTGLAVAWCATILAILAIGYGTMKYVTLTERRMKFVSAATHELRTPLTSFQLYTDLLADGPSDEERRAEYVGTLRTESRRLARLVENVLSYSRMADAAPKMHRRIVAPQALLDTVSTDTAVQRNAAGKELVIENACNKAMTIETDPEFVVQILVNLVENACKYSADATDPRIWLSVSVSSDGVLTFDVEDAGEGVAAKDRKAIFEPFRRSNMAQDSGAGGMGLGLALSRYWATSLGGSLILKRGSRQTGSHQYACFSLSLPTT